MRTLIILPDKRQYIFMLALALVSFSFVLQENIGFDLGDEGSLWYSAIYTGRGDIPGVDFIAYDPGRYYWILPLFFLLGQGLMALRFSVATFQFVGLLFGLFAVGRVVKSRWGLALAGLLLLVWMYPRHKLFESSVAMMAVYFAVRLVEQPTFRQAFKAGIFVGLAAFMGRNHGVYNFLAFLALFCFLEFKLKQGLLFKRLGVWLAGVGVGYAPMLFMLVFAPGLLDRTFQRIASPFINKGVTNVPLPVPWPWTIDYTALDIFGALFMFFLGICFVALPLFYLCVLLSLLLAKPANLPGRSLLLASSWVGVFYMHHAFSRADLPHLAQSIHPFLLGVIALPYAYSFVHRQKVTLGLATALTIVTTFAMVVSANPYWQLLRNREQFTLYQLGEDRIWVRKEQAAYIETIKQLVNRYLKPDDKLLITGRDTALYPILHRRSPIREIYFIVPAPPGREDEIIQTLIAQEVKWVILTDIALDGRNDLRLPYTHPLLWKYFGEAFEPVTAPGLPAYQQLLRRKEIEPNLSGSFR